MEKIIELLKNNRDLFLDYQKKTNCNMLLCLVGVEYDKEALEKVASEGWQKMVAYFPRGKMSHLEINLIENQDAPSYAIAGITFLEGKMFYFVATRIRAGKKMTAKQKNYDHLYHNQKIYIFTTEEGLVQFVAKSDDFCTTFTMDDIYEMTHEFIKESLEHDTEKKFNPMKSSIINGILEINPIASLADQIV